MLPKLEYPSIDIELKSSKKKLKFRPILVKEEKLLLMAKEGANDSDIFNAVKQVVANCSIDPAFNVDKLPLFELEYIFLYLRMQSINNVVELSYHDNEDKQDYKFSVNLEDIKIKYPETKVSNTINIDNTKTGLVLRYPPASLYSNDKFLKSTSVTETFEEVLLNSIEQIFDEENVYDLSNGTTTKEEIIEFIDNVSSSTYKKIQVYFDSIPYMEHIINYKNKNGTERNISLRTLNDFFIL
jgi:hypothetical protein